jgi:hypothetical protein
VLFPWSPVGRSRLFLFYKKEVKKMNRDLKIAILAAGYNSQHDFSDAVNMGPPIVSNVVHNRRKLTKAQAKVWQAVLQCKPKLLKAITD